MKHLLEALSKSKIRKLEKSHNDDFIEYCKDFIYDNLYNFEGQTLDSSNLSIELTKEINDNGGIIFNRYKVEKILKSWSKYYDWYINKMKFYNYNEDEYLTIDDKTGEVELDIYNYPELTMARFVIFGVDDILLQCKTLIPNKITLTQDIIDKIKSEVKQIKTLL